MPIATCSLFFVLRSSFFALGLLSGGMLLLTGCTPSSNSDAAQLADQYNLSPVSRTLGPTAIAGTAGQVTSTSGGLLNGGSAVLQGQGSYIVLDFGKEVGGIVSLQFGEASEGSQLAMAFSESSLYAGLSSDQSNGGSGPDGFLPVTVTPNSTYLVPAAELRGGFRYLTVGLTTNGPVQLTEVTLQFSAAPSMMNLRTYRGSFFSSDDLLNRIWYAGAYTVQMDTINPAQGRVWPPPSAGWSNNGIGGSGSTILVDGAKRDRMVWSGDLGISAISDYASLGDTVSIRNDLETLFANQDPSGCFPFSGPEANLGPVSDTYHLWTLDAAIDYYLYSADRDWLVAHWNQIQSGIQFSTSKIDSNGLLSVTLLDDWFGLSPGGEEIGANALLYHVLQGAAFLASEIGDTPSESQYETAAYSLRTAIHRTYGTTRWACIPKCPEHFVSTGRQLAGAMVWDSRHGSGANGYRNKSSKPMERLSGANAGTTKSNCNLSGIDGSDGAFRSKRRHYSIGLDPAGMGLHAFQPPRDRKHVLGGVTSGRQFRLWRELHEPCAWLGDRPYCGPQPLCCRDRTGNVLDRSIPFHSPCRRSFSGCGNRPPRRRERIGIVEAVSRGGSLQL